MDAWKNSRDITMIKDQVAQVKGYLQTLERRILDLNSRLQPLEKKESVKQKKSSKDKK